MDHRNILPDSEKPSYDSAVFPLESDSESSKVERGGRRSKRNRGRWNSLLRSTNVRVIRGSRFSAIEVFDRKLDIRLGVPGAAKRFLARTNCFGTCINIMLIEEPINVSYPCLAQDGGCTTRCARASLLFPLVAHSCPSHNSTLFYL
ncbi:hypothetical protein HYDPIDRAFT_117500 [Hydnomerulius pinastri MD-312]|uniref:Uncharacterized protein n=1 Tax=Hydnomerulius pinastri MD-312 TaxID=994086 RepID=A0A0C9WAN1_9AGAM|nr:hypothetical protein HYDPIDRAFT_117500 [Hydnomerulius pinastri MD-312]